MQSFKSFGVDLIKLWLDLIFPEKLLVHTGRVRYDLGRVRYFSLWSFELKFGGDLPLVSKELWLKFHDFWTPFDGVLDFSLLVSLLLKIPDVSDIIPDVSDICRGSAVFFWEFARLGFDLCSVCSVVTRCVLREHPPFSRVVVIKSIVYAFWGLILEQWSKISKEI